MTTTMRDLIAERHRAGLRQLDIADALGMPRSRLAVFEAAREVQPTKAWAAAYIAAIESLKTMGRGAENG